MVVAALMYGLAFNGGFKPLLMFDAFKKCAEPRALELGYG